MSKIAVVYYSSTGNTKAMAEAVADGVTSAGANVDLLTSAEFDALKIENYDAIAFGCSAMGAEVLEETEFEPMFQECEPNLKGKKIALFGSYGWGDGEWMRNWEERCKECGVCFTSDFVICNEFPDDEAIEKCKALGESLTK